MFLSVTKWFMRTDVYYFKIQSYMKLISRFTYREDVIGQTFAAVIFLPAKQTKKLVNYAAWKFSQ